MDIGESASMADKDELQPHAVPYVVLRDANAGAFFSTNSRTVIGGTLVNLSTSWLSRSYRLS